MHTIFLYIISQFL